MTIRMIIRAVVCAALCGASLATTSCTLLRRGAKSPTGAEGQAPQREISPDAAEVTIPTTVDAVPVDEEPDALNVPPRDPSVPVHMPQWDTLNLFAYRGVALADLPESMVVDMTADGFCAPAVGRVFSPYSRRRGRNHNGTDISVALGQPIHSAFDGVVRLSRWNSGGYGHIVIVRHPSGLETYYAHLSKRTVRAGEAVKAGDVIGLGGRTGRATALHLHFEVRYCDQSFDPERLIDFATGKQKTGTLALRKEHFSINSRAGDGHDAPEGEPPGGAEGLPDDGAVLASAYVPPAAAATASTAKPAAKTAAQATVYHKIRGGDTLYSLARRYGTTVAKLCSLNGISSRTTLRIGRSLRMK